MSRRDGRGCLGRAGGLSSGLSSGRSGQKSGASAEQGKRNQAPEMSCHVGSFPLCEDTGMGLVVLRPELVSGSSAEF